SQQRAEEAEKYLISKGATKKRVVIKGYGETKLLNKCNNVTECSDKEHQENRRTEFKILKI
ncbi:MAG: outer membrane protein OmpA-like peptidoglycan-associated protein, partial [Flavobacteriales bacterium]